MKRRFGVRLNRRGQLRVYHVDAFARRVFEGNPAGVVVLDRWRADERLAQIAEEHRLPETAFVVKEGSRWRLRWFTPTQEVPFCGHATLAASHILRTEYSTGTHWEFETAVGVLSVAYGNGRYTLDVPRLDPASAAAFVGDLADLYPLGSIDAFRNFENLFAVLPDEDAVLSYAPDLARIAKLHPLGFAITAVSHKVDFVSRYFAPSYGIPEDPVTGSTHATLAPYWADKLGRRTLVARQCSPRGGELGLHVRPDRVQITGQAVTYLRGVVETVPARSAMPGSATGPHTSAST